MKTKIYYMSCLRSLAGLLMLVPAFANAQVIIGFGATIAATQDTEIAIIAPSDINNGSSFDFSTTVLTADLVGADQTLAGNIVLSELSLSGSGTKTINGNITVSKKLTFTQGMLKPLSSVDKFLFTGAPDGIQGASDVSFFDCTDTGSGVPTFYSNGSGDRLFPIGVQNLYTPATLFGITGETGVSVVAADPDLDKKDTVEFYSVNNQRYWQITNVANVNGDVQLALIGLEDYLAQEGTPTIVQADGISQQPENIGNSASDNTNTYIKSSAKPTAPYLAIGKEKKFKVRVHDLITPSGLDGHNDVLTIDYLDKFTFKHVTLLDRWGVLIKEWSDFSEAIAKAYDFNQLGAGNYIVVVEYGKDGEKKMVEQQMVTVLKTN